MWDTFLMAIALMLVLEGILPFTFPIEDRLIP